ncbi:MAG TPA: c-type cytochrome domain-containing protein [Steroidobacteraceae bacterium]|nr:c-type cytochrome domain-containing protein [Steroidobacteraceae bacterium]
MTSMRTACPLAIALVLSACAREPEAVTYADVEPIFDQYCVSCHQPGQPGYEASGLDMTSYEAIMKGTRFGPVVLPGEPQTSTLVMLLEGRADPSIQMPHGDAPSPYQAEIEKIRSWVAHGAER